MIFLSQYGVLHFDCHSQARNILKHSNSKMIDIYENAYPPQKWVSYYPRVSPWGNQEPTASQST